VRRSDIGYWAASGATALLAAYAVFYLVDHGGETGGPPVLPAQVIAESPSPRPVLTAAAPLGPALPRSAPKKIYIPKIALRAMVDRVGLNAKGAVKTPPYETANRAAWYEHGPSPGERGAAVIAGHVDDKKKVAVFFYLSRLRPGDEIDVLRHDGLAVTFTVTSIEQVSKNRFPADRVYATGNEPLLRLVTCGGAYDAATGHYADNIIVFARLARMGPYRG
jgi:hypothetical protein